MKSQEVDKLGALFGMKIKFYAVKDVGFNFNFFAILLYFLLSAVKMRGYLFEGRFWAEEGRFFYSEIVNKDWVGGVFYIFNGHLEIVTNAIVFVSTLFDLKYAPLVTTYLSLLVQFIPVYLIIKYRSELSISRFGVIIVIFVAAGLPQAAEVWANSINLHFHFSLIVALIAAIGVANGPSKWVSRILLGVSGLSGIPANFLFPVFAVLAFKNKEKERWVQFFILLFTAVLQVFLLVFNGYQSEGREYFSAPQVFLLAPVVQLVALPLFGSYIGGYLADILREPSYLSVSYFVFLFVLSLPLVYLILKSIRGALSSIGVIVFSAFILVFLSIFTSLGDKSMLISGTFGWRYFYVPNILLLIAFLSLSRAYDKLALVFVFFVFINSVGSVGHFIGGPSWSANFCSSCDGNKSIYNIWPHGFTMDLSSQSKVPVNVSSPSEL
ncbi:hypothetical protein [Marichromatium bheemlicum]|uniref:Uncharacterized protein n=1 Tax=Marichromatium bheemlicum TaxID=365339 RepID=A0ABX1I9T7_9GAMM|nr:hypothetical protein [Marichromatium bheemlicum]NKN32886.1 hypothetical protein [Marichromatium bheemlicum]